MNKDDREWLVRIEGKLDSQGEKVVQTAQILVDHLAEHDRKTKTRYFVIGTLITAVTVLINALLDYVGGLFGGR